MHMYSFSAPQADHALAVVLKLMKERRFFLFQQEEYNRKIEGDSGHGLDSTIFGPAIALDEKVRAVYTASTRLAEENILSCEKGLGLKGPDLSGNKRLVQCNRYTGGLDICRVYPSTAFTELAPDSLEELQVEEMARLMGTKTPDDYSPKEMQELRGSVEINACKIWEEIKAIKSLESGNSCVVLLETRFEPTEGYREDDFLQGRVADIRLFPYGMGYLFYEYSKRIRIVRHAHVVFNTSRKAHVNVQHWSNGGLSLRFDSKGGYVCRIYFPIVL